MENKNQMIAAVAAVMDYLRTEEDMVMQAVTPPAPPKLPTEPSAKANFWSQSGRQAQMQIRNMLQLKILR